MNRDKIKSSIKNIIKNNTTKNDQILSYVTKNMYIINYQYLDLNISFIKKNKIKNVLYINNQISDAKINIKNGVIITELPIYTRIYDIYESIYNHIKSNNKILVTSNDDYHILITICYYMTRIHKLKPHVHKSVLVSVYRLICKKCSIKYNDNYINILLDIEEKILEGKSMIDINDSSKNDSSKNINDSSKNTDDISSVETSTDTYDKEYDDIDNVDTYEDT